MSLKGTPLIYNKRGARIKIGKNVTIKSSFLSNLVGLYSRTIIVTRAQGAAIEIGDNVGISGATIYARKGIYIGENTCIGGNCKILDNDFHPIEAEARLKLLQDVHGGDSALIPCREIRKLLHRLQRDHSQGHGARRRLRGGSGRGGQRKVSEQRGHCGQSRPRDTHAEINAPRSSDMGRGMLDRDGERC